MCAQTEVFADAETEMRVGIAVDPEREGILEDRLVAVRGTGGIAVFSSLTPHLTGPNRSDAVRKTYILQYTPAGAVVWRGTPGSDPIREPVGNAPFQFPVLRAGREAGSSL